MTLLSDSLIENEGVHLHALIQRTGCGIHSVPEGVPCYTVPSYVYSQTDYVGVCGSRIKKGGFIGRVSAQSMRTEAPKKPGTGGKRPFKKKPNTRPAQANGFRGKK